MKNQILILLLSLFVGFSTQAQAQVERDPLLPAEFKTQKQYAEHVLTNAPIIIQGHIIKYEDHTTSGTVALVQVDEVIRGSLKKGTIRMYFPTVSIGGESCHDCTTFSPEGEAFADSKLSHGYEWWDSDRFFYFSKFSTTKLYNYENENLTNTEILVSYRDDYYSYVKKTKPQYDYSASGYAYGFVKGVYMPMLDFYRYLSKFPNINQVEIKLGTERLKAVETQMQSNKEALYPKKSDGGSFGDGLSDEPIVITATEQSKTSLWTDPDIEVQMNNGRYFMDVNSNQWWIFDVSASVINYDNPATYVNTIPIRFNFNTTIFGTNLYANNNIRVYMHDDLTTTEQATYYVSRQDMNGGSEIELKIDPQLGLANYDRVALSNIPKGIIEVWLRIQNCAPTSGLNLLTPANNPNAYYTTNYAASPTSNFFQYGRTTFYQPNFRISIPTDVCDVPAQQLIIVPETFDGKLRAGVSDTLSIYAADNILTAFGTTKGKIKFHTASKPYDDTEMYYILNIQVLSDLLPSK